MSEPSIMTPATTDAVWPRAQWPALLTRIDDPPSTLWYRGDLQVTRDPCVAIVGSRRASATSQTAARDLARDLGRHGVTIVSGLAFGIDAAAHAGAIETGHTIAVIATGIDRVYPTLHASLSRAIVTRGLVLSEFPPGSPPLKHHFPRRNRLISGLSLGVVVIEAPERSGALITARNALDQGREVMVVPGPSAGGRHRGGHLLVNDGARLVETVDDVLAAVGLLRPGQHVEAGPPPPDDPVFLALVPAEPADLDDVVVRTGLAPAAVLARLASLELAGWVERVAGGRFVRLGRKW